MRYIALLRGINVGGNNKVSMTDLKQCFEQLGFEHVSSYINSGNILFDADEKDIHALIVRCEKAIEMKFGFHVTCSVMAADDVKAALDHAPQWWGRNDTDKHNALFVIPPATPASVMEEVGKEKPEYEKIASYGSVIFWTAPLKTFGRTRYSKIVGTKAYQSITIRNANTMRKLVELARG